MSEPLAGEELNKLNYLTECVYAHAAENRLKFAANKLLRFTSIGVCFEHYSLKRLLAGGKIKSFKMHGINTGSRYYKLTIKKPKLLINFVTKPFYSEIEVFAMVDNKKVCVTNEDGPWHDEVRKLIKELDNAYKMATNGDDPKGLKKLAAERADDLGKARKVFIPTKNRQSNPLSK